MVTELKSIDCKYTTTQVMQLQLIALKFEQRYNNILTKLWEAYLFMYKPWQLHMT